MKWNQNSVFQREKKKSKTQTIWCLFTLYDFPRVMMGWFMVLASPEGKTVIYGIGENWPHEVPLSLVSTIFHKLGKSQTSAWLPEEGFVRRTCVKGHVVSDLWIHIWTLWMHEWTKQREAGLSVSSMWRTYSYVPTIHCFFSLWAVLVPGAKYSLAELSQYKAFHSHSPGGCFKVGHMPQLSHWEEVRKTIFMIKKHISFFSNM